MARGKAMELVAAAQAAQGEIPAGYKLVARSGNPFKNPGDTVQGEFQGAGEGMKIGKKTCRTWRVGPTLLLESAQLDRFFEEMEPGTDVFIRYDGQIKGGKGRVNTYTFAIKE